MVFDEAHNIDNVCIESLSIDLTEDSLRKATRGANNLERKIEEMKASDEDKLQNEYQRLVEGLREADEARAEDAFMSNPTLPNDLLKEAVPGNIRRAGAFRGFPQTLRRVSEDKNESSICNTGDPAFISCTSQRSDIHRAQAAAVLCRKTHLSCPNSGIDKY